MTLQSPDLLTPYLPMADADADGSEAAAGGDVAASASSAGDAPAGPAHPGLLPAPAPQAPSGAAGEPTARAGAAPGPPAPAPPALAAPAAPEWPEDSLEPYSRACWEGAVPLCIELDPSELPSGRPAPAPFYVLAPRMGYLPLAWGPAAAHFAAAAAAAAAVERDAAAAEAAVAAAAVAAGAAPAEPAAGAAPAAAAAAAAVGAPYAPGCPWLSHQGLPLRWQVPTGVLHDLLTAGERPWRLRMHFRSEPPEALLPFAGEDPVRAALFNSLKEASYIQHGTAAPVMSLPAAAQAELTAALGRADGPAYERIAAALAPAGARGGGGGGSGGGGGPTGGAPSGAASGAGGGSGPQAGRGPRAVPLRLYIRQAGRILRWDDITCVSRPMEATGPPAPVSTSAPAGAPGAGTAVPAGAGGGVASGEAPSAPRTGTLRWALERLLPEVDFGPPDAPPVAAAAAEPSGAAFGPFGAFGASAGASAASDTGSGSAGSSGGHPAVDVLVQGVRPPLGAPLAWLAPRLRGPDRFLHVVVCVRG